MRGTPRAAHATHTRGERKTGQVSECRGTYDMREHSDRRTDSCGKGIVVNTIPAHRVHASANNIHNLHQCMSMHMCVTAHDRTYINHAAHTRNASSWIRNSYVTSHLEVLT